MKVLVTSSTGLTGRAVVRSLSRAGATVRAMVHSEARSAEMIALGASSTIVASIESERDLRRAMHGADTVFYICPTAHPEEGRIGRMAVDIAADEGIGRFVYQSVLHSIEPELPHHRRKLSVEQHLLESSLTYKILRPAAFMQNLEPMLRGVLCDGIFKQRFFESADASNRINLIDAADYAEAAARIALSDEFDYGTFDLCGPENLSARDMLSALSATSGTDIQLNYITDSDFEQASRAAGWPESKISTLQSMFAAYRRFGFPGSAFTTRSILGRTPSTLRAFLAAAVGRISCNEKKSD